jgi:ribulose 1,5-bisphosphate synthetase/thiazole synthase
MLVAGINNQVTTVMIKYKGVEMASQHLLPLFLSTKIKIQQKNTENVLVAIKKLSWRNNGDPLKKSKKIPATELIISYTNNSLKVLMVSGIASIESIEGNYSFSGILSNWKATGVIVLEKRKKTFEPIIAMKDPNSIVIQMTTPWLPASWSTGSG